MAINEIKTNIKKKVETKDAPQANGNYKIRQITKIMEYTHTDTHTYMYIYIPISKMKTVQKN